MVSLVVDYHQMWDVYMFMVISDTSIEHPLRKTKCDRNFGYATQPTLANSNCYILQVKRNNFILYPDTKQREFICGSDCIT